MAGRPRTAISWSGGKDSCAALHRTHTLYDIVAMVTMFDEDAARSRSHGLRPEILQAQADRLGLRPEMLDAFARLGVDPCPSPFTPGAQVQRSGCWALDLTLDDAASH